MIKIYDPESLSQESSDQKHGALASDNPEDLRIKLDTLTARVLYLEQAIKKLESS